MGKRIFFAGAALLHGVAALAVDAAYLANFDLLWDRVPKAYAESAFLGNGVQGTCIWAARGEALHFDIGDTRVYSGKSRVPIGKFVLSTVGKPTGFSMRLKLANAQAVGELETSRGTVRFRSLVSAAPDVALAEFSVSGNEKIGIGHFALPAGASDKLFAIRKKKGYKLGNPRDFSDPQVYAALMDLDWVKRLPKEVRGKQAGVDWRFVPMAGGQGYALAWKFARVASNRYLLAWTTDYALDAAKLSKTAGVVRVEKAFDRGYDALAKAHDARWADYYSRTALSIPDKRMEANYWIQSYRYGSATRKGALPIDLLGPWFRATPWPRIWLNLNLQLTYYPMAAGNHPEIAATLADWVDANTNIFIEAAGDYRSDSAACGRGTPPYGPTHFWGEYGNLLWILSDYWNFLRTYPDDRRTVERFYPMLKRAVEFSVHALRKGEDGRLHMPLDISPEWKVKAEDTTYDLELLCWGLETAIRIDDRFELGDPDIVRYRVVLENLAQKHVGPDGIMIGKDVPLTGPHRHYSHLIGLYPLRRIDIDNPEERALYKRSIEHWLGFKLPRPLTRNDWSYKGYTWTGATAMYAMLDEPEKAVAQLRKYLDIYPWPNTFYMETGPVIETPFSAAAATQELLLQGWGVEKGTVDLLRLFPGVPADWPSAWFDGLRAEGGYTVSAASRDGKTVAFRIRADRPRPLRLRFKASAVGQIKTPKGSPFETKKLANGWVQAEGVLLAGETLSLGDMAAFERPVADARTSARSYHYGLNGQEASGKTTTE